MATITVEIGRKGKKKARTVSFLISQGNTKKRIPTEVFVTDSEVSSNGKKIKNPIKAKLIEEMRRKLEDKLFSLSLEIVGGNMGSADFPGWQVRQIKNKVLPLSPWKLPNYSVPSFRMCL